ncbi:MAG: DUF4114 domain-containing protein [Pseudobdellovibrionaceae bacterium]
MATSGNDNIVFTGTNERLTMTLVNAYTGETYYVDNIYNVNNSVYDGLAGVDTLFMSNSGDALFLEDLNGNQTLYNVERVVGGRGSDLIILSSDTITLGNLLIDGGTEGDIIWSNSGDDIITAYDGADIVLSGPGADIVLGGTGDDLLKGGDDDDTLYGEQDNDTLYGNDGNDTLDGGDGDDILYGGHYQLPIIIDKRFSSDVLFPDLKEGVDIGDLAPPGDPALGIQGGQLHIDMAATATLTFRHGYAGYNNTLGIFSLGEDGTLHFGTILWENVKDAGTDIAHTITLPVGENGGDFGFFIIADGDRTNHGYNSFADVTGEGNISFIYHYGLVDERAATLADAGSSVSIVYSDGVNEQVLQGNAYYTTGRDEYASLNADGLTHAVAGQIAPDNFDVLRIGFEDLYGGGDRDYEDVLFDIDVNPTTIDPSETGADTLIGGAGNDTLYGEGGDDILIIGNGLDHAFGGSGADTFRFDMHDSLVDIIGDFDSAEGDVLDLSELVGSVAAGHMSDYVQFQVNGADVDVMLNASGAAGGSYEHLATLTGAAGTDFVEGQNVIL